MTIVYALVLLMVLGSGAQAQDKPIPTPQNPAPGPSSMEVLLPPEIINARNQARAARFHCAGAMQARCNDPGERQWEKLAKPPQQ